MRAGMSGDRRWEGVPGVRYPKALQQLAANGEPPQGWLPCREVARLLGCCKGTVRALLGPVACRSRRGWFFAPEVVRPLVRNRRLSAPPPGFCSSADAGRLFGIRRWRLCCLLAQGLVRAVPGKGRRGAFCYWYCTEDLAAFSRCSPGDGSGEG